MPLMFLPVGPMSPDYGPGLGDHSWYIINMAPLGGGGYSSIGELVEAKQSPEIVLGATERVRGVGHYRGAYAADTVYIALDARIMEGGTDRSGAAYGNTTATWGVQFASFGPYQLATNRVDQIQFRDVTGVANFANITVPTLGADPRASAICVYKNHVIIGNVKMNANYGALLTGTYPSLVWWSATDNAFAYGTPKDSPSLLGTDYKQTFDGEGEVVKLIATDSCVFIFKTRSIMRMDGPPFEISLVSSQYGTRHPMSVKLLGRRVYFVAETGPAYLDVDSNEIVNIGWDRVQRALSIGDGHTGYTMPVGPRGDGTSRWGIASYTGSGISQFEVSAAVDVFSRRVVFRFAYDTGTTGYGSYANNGFANMASTTTLVYDEGQDEFFLWAPHTREVTAALTYDVVTEAVSSYLPYHRLPLGDVMFLSRKAGTTNLNYYRLATNSMMYDSGKGATGTICWPFKTFSDISKGASSRILAVKPVWYSEWETDYDVQFKARVYTGTLDGPGNWFGLDRAVVTTSTSASDDGWLKLESSPFGMVHSISIDISADPTGELNWTTIRGFYGLIVKYAEGPGRNA